ncbi:hypothetical protein POM88_025595 [Heracleum sosnowskyi]|uniref:Helitron helicase-like domain-containing protein n=1 Tax=Heracleum sosnowskyi TaxID=360622 RepID=A0AAD8I5B8_9APIA|nr:hypothetical protein POM88_025595 [Heracleum sosnowskyi]
MDLPGQTKSNNERRIQRNKRRREAYNKQTEEERSQRNKLRRDQRNKQNSGIVQHEVEGESHHCKIDELQASSNKHLSEQNTLAPSTACTGKIQITKRQNFQNKVFAEVSTRMRNKVNATKLAFAEANSILNIGSADEECIHCKAMMWKYERTKQQEILNSRGFSLCCSEGKVQLPHLQDTPIELKNLLDGTDEISRHFQKKRRMYNNVFAFTSTGGKIDNRFNQGGGPFVYRVLGEMYHQMGSLLPDNDNSKAVYSQIYMFDNEQELESRLHFPRDNETLDVRIIEPLSSMLDRENEMVKNFRQARDRPDIICRVFKIKLDMLLEDLTQKHVLGKVIGVAYTIEFQKRGLPHAHITTIDQNGYPIYKRRDDGRTITCRGVEIDNRFVVPYNRGLLVKYQAHINVEWCHQGKLIKYMFKYVLKGPDRATMVVERDGQPQ